MTASIERRCQRPTVASRSRLVTSSPAAPIRSASRALTRFHRPPRVRYAGKTFYRQLRGRAEGVCGLTLPKRGSGKKHVRVIFKPRGSSADALKRGTSRRLTVVTR